MLSVRRSLVPSGTEGVKATYRGQVPPVAVRNVDGGAVIEGYAAVWNRYSANLGGFVEQIDPDAFTRSMADDDQIASYDHEYASLLGRRQSGTLTVEADNLGLRYSIPVDMGDPDHQRVVAKIQRGDLKGSSFSMIPAPDGCEWDYTEQGMLLCTVRSARLLEVAPVVFPAYPTTEDDAFRVSLRSLATRTGRDLDDLVAAAKRGDLTDTVGSTLDAADGDAVSAGDDAGVGGEAVAARSAGRGRALAMLSLVERA